MSKFSFNINGIGVPICKIVGGEYDQKYVYLADSKQVEQKKAKSKYINFSRMNLAEESSFQPVPNSEGRDIVSCFGPSGSGKSYYIKDFVKNYHQEYPKNSVYCVSLVDDDKSFKDIPYIIRLKVDEKWKNNPLEAKDFEDNCCIIFDDTDTIRDKDIKKNIDMLKNQILETGRHKHITALITSHLACKGVETKTLLNESHLITI